MAAVMSNGPIETMRFKVKMKKTVRGFKKGTKTKVTQNRQKQWISLVDGQEINRKAFTLVKQIFNNTIRYTPEAAQNWVNSQGFSSPTGWLFWCNKWGQRVYIFQGSQGAWTLVKVCKCGTGNIAYGEASDTNIKFNGWKFYDKKKAFQGPQGMQYYNSHYSSAHGNSIHKGPAGHPSSHGCICLPKNPAIWVYNNVPINTPVIVF